MGKYDAGATFNFCVVAFVSLQIHNQYQMTANLYDGDLLSPLDSAKIRWPGFLFLPDEPQHSLRALGRECVLLAYCVIEVFRWMWWIMYMFDWLVYQHTSI